MFNCTIHPRVTAGLNPGTVYSFRIFYFGKRYILSKFSIIVFHAFPSIIYLKLDPSKLNFTTEFHAQNAANGIFGVQISKIFRGGMPPDPPSWLKPANMLRSDFRLDPPLLPLRYYLTRS